ncbi:MAG: enoyl-CoA hydratase/isomerase family protein [Deltaproteobacteria bacterium]|nr:enoyl-CoA hydratase/isomerase family protein [Deltaproteobacteria bacterium]
MTEKRESVDFIVEDRIALVTIDRSPVNALNRQVEEEIEAVFEELGTISEVGAVIVMGGGNKAFIAGADIKDILGKDQDGAFQMSASTQKVPLKIEKFEKVVIAAVNGLALGGGCEVALACDIRVIDESAVIGLPEVGLGLLPGAGGTQRLSRLVGIGKAKELILTGDPINADEAKRIGLVERVAKKGEAIAEAKKLAKRILLRGPVAVANAKRAINDGFDMSYEDALRRETQLFSELFITQDMVEGVNAFLEKRIPNFMGK